MRIILLLFFLFSSINAQKCDNVLALNYGQLGDCIFENINPPTISVNQFSTSNKLTRLYEAIQVCKSGKKQKVDYTFTVLKYDTDYFLGYKENGSKVVKHTSSFKNLRFGQVLSETVKALIMYEKLFESLFPNLDLNFVFKPIELLPNNHSYLTAADIIIEPYRAPFSATYAITSVGSLSNISFNTAKPYGLDCDDNDNKVSFLRVLIHELGHSFGIKHCSYTSINNGIRDEIMLTKVPSKNDDICDSGYYENLQSGKKYLRLDSDLLNSYTIKNGIFNLYNQNRQ